MYSYRGLKKDNFPETFNMRHKTIEGFYLPVQYIKIVPLQSWGPASNYSIWFVEFQGKDSPELINKLMDTINLVRRYMLIMYCHIYL